ncbi:MAG: hypothetical protein PHU25_10950 [Deltaproteobacteria bacterium]|nr:hypothetical protein [Deltaproteobacteria bacterium]
MGVENRQWWVRIRDAEEGPIPESAFQDRLRAGEFPLGAEIKSSEMAGFEPLIDVISKDESFHRRSTAPPAPAKR